MRFRMKHKLALILAGYVTCFVGLATLGLWAGGYHLMKADASNPFMHNRTFVTDTAYVNLPTVKLSLSKPTTLNQKDLRMEIALEVGQKNEKIAEGYVPRMVDHIVSFTQKYDFNSIKNPRDFEAFRKQMLQTIQEASGPIPIVDVTFRKFVMI